MSNPSESPDLKEKETIFGTVKDDCYKFGLAGKIMIVSAFAVTLIIVLFLIFAFIGSETMGEKSQKPMKILAIIGGVIVLAGASLIVGAAVGGAIHVSHNKIKGI